MKLIRECRMGEPKSYKTGAVVGTYPKPMLYLQFDRGGIDVIPSKNQTLDSKFIQPDTRYEEIEKVKPGEIGQYLMGQKPFPRILCIDYTISETMSLTQELIPSKASQPFNNFIADYNQIATWINMNPGKSLPWKTVVMDSVTGYEDMVLSHIASFSPGSMQDARQWAGQVGGKVRQTILTLTTWPCHVVVLMHAAMDKDEHTGVVTMRPNVFSAGLRADIAGLFSQFFYSTKDPMGTPVLWTNVKMFVTGVGARWPLDLPTECKPDFNTIYGREGLV